MNENSYNEIDLECSLIDDDDSFGSIKIVDSNTQDDSLYEDASNSRAPVKTGIMIDLRDDDISPRDKLKTISATTSEDGGITIKKNFTPISFDDEFQAKDFNEIDMETDISEDDEDFIPESDELDVNEKFEDDFDDKYWEKLNKKYKNSKSHSIHTHYAGDPELELAMFNNGIGKNEAPEVESSEATADAAEGAAVASESFDLNGDKKLTSSSKLNDVFDLIGFEIIENPDNSISAIDVIDETTPEISAKTVEELLQKLSPYIDDCIVCPLEVTTGEKFKNYSEWVNWYNDTEKQAKYPNIKKDIAYCDLLASYHNKVKDEV